MTQFNKYSYLIKLFKTIFIQVNLTMSIIVSASMAKQSPISSQPVESWHSIRTAN